MCRSLADGGRRCEGCRAEARRQKYAGSRAQQSRIERGRRARAAQAAGRLLAEAAADEAAAIKEMRAAGIPLAVAPDAAADPALWELPDDWRKPSEKPRPGDEIRWEHRHPDGRLEQRAGRLVDRAPGTGQWLAVPEQRWPGEAWGVAVQIRAGEASCDGSSEAYVRYSQAGFQSGMGDPDGEQIVETEHGTVHRAGCPQIRPSATTTPTSLRMTGGRVRDGRPVGGHLPAAADEHLRGRSRCRCVGGSLDMARRHAAVEMSDAFIRAREEREQMATASPGSSNAPVVLAEPPGPSATVRVRREQLERDAADLSKRKQARDLARHDLGKLDHALAEAGDRPVILVDETRAGDHVHVGSLSSSPVQIDKVLPSGQRTVVGVAGVRLHATDLVVLASRAPARADEAKLPAGLTVGTNLSPYRETHGWVVRHAASGRPVLTGYSSRGAAFKAAAKLAGPDWQRPACDVVADDASRSLVNGVKAADEAA